MIQETKPERFEFYIAVGGLRGAQENLRKEKRKKMSDPERVEF